MAVVLHPGIKTGLCRTLYLASWCLQNQVDGFVEEFEILTIVNQLGTAQQQIVVVTGEAFKEPQQFGVILLGVVVAHELGGAQLFHIPSVKILVTDES